MARDKFNHQFLDLLVVGSQFLGFLGLEHHILDLLHLRRGTGQAQLVIVRIDIGGTPLENLQVGLRRGHLGSFRRRFRSDLGGRHGILELHHAAGVLRAALGSRSIYGHHGGNRTFDHFGSVLSDTTVLCAINFAAVLDEHIASGCDITVIAKAGRANGKTRQPLAVKLGDDGKIVDLAVDYCAPEDYLVGMSMFIMRRDKLIQVIREMVPHGKYHLERDFILPEYNAGNLKVNVYPFHNVALFNQSVDEYFVNNMKLLEPDVRRSLFRSEIPIYTKVRDAVPTLFGYHGQAANCLIADGCHLFGKAENSVIFREVDIEDGAEVRDSIIMQGSKIGAGASIRYCILDKNVTIRPGTKLLGSIDHPLVVDKGDTV